MQFTKAIMSAAVAAVMATAAHASAGSGACQPEVGFSPEGSAAALVDRAIDSAQRSIRVSAYSFTSPDVVRHLLQAKRRGVEVAVVVDEKSNVNEDRSGKAHAALNLLVNARIPVRTVGVYPSHHDKVLVVDGSTVETGSFNYSQAAASRNSENALVLWDCPGVARGYLEHWQSRWDQGVEFRSSY
ncbi:phospholipase D family protein [Paraburkholderia youngii]|uniref:phospholipase D family nuclease n=1 Tax=Paraburkholderia youngii TaxID=2782701 RepID=UPI003D2540DC